MCSTDLAVDGESVDDPNPVLEHRVRHLTAPIQNALLCIIEVAT